MLQLRLVVPALVVGAFALGAACSVYDEGLLGAGGEADDSGSTRSSASGDGGSDGDGGAATGSTTSDGATTTTSSTTTGATGTVTTGGGCDTVDDCPGRDSDCAERSCDDGACNVINLEQGTEIAGQTPGDCVKLVCDGQGTIATENDDTDVPSDDGNDCTLSACDAGRPVHPPVEEGDPCDQDGGSFCTADAQCVECLVDEDCTESCSEANTCVQAECDDGDFNGLETDTDCGGPDCDPCLNGDTCEDDTDCVSGDCDVTCQPSCTDGVVGPGETDVDCGGVCDDECVLGQACEGDGDCDSDHCMSLVCRPRLFFSEYVEGSGSNKALEVYSYGNVAVDLATATCFVRVFSNGSTTASQNIGLTGTIAALEVHVLCSDDFAVDNPTLCDQDSTANLWNGNDAIALDCMGVRLDVFGQIGFDPGNGSNPAPGWGTDPTNSVDNTLRRKEVLLVGDPDGSDAFDPAEDWDGEAVDTFDGLGFFPDPG